MKIEFEMKTIWKINVIQVNKMSADDTLVRNGIAFNYMNIWYTRVYINIKHQIYRIVYTYALIVYIIV